MTNIETRVAILASGDRKTGEGGSTMNRVIRDTLDGTVGFQIGVVICNNPEGTVGVWPKVDQINKDFGLTGDDKIEVVHIGPQNFPGGKQERGQTLDESSAICRELERRNIGFVSMLGYMRILTGELIETWGYQRAYSEADRLYNGIYYPNARIINNHPGLLPHTADTHGRGTHQRAYDLYHNSFIERTAMTWHLAEAGIDTGPVVFAQPIDINPTDTVEDIEDNVQDVEKHLSAFVIERHLEMREEQLRYAA